MQVRSLGRGWPSVGAVGQDGFAIKVYRFLCPHPQPFGPDATGTVASSWMPLAMAAFLPQCLLVEEYRRPWRGNPSASSLASQPPCRFSGARSPRPHPPATHQFSQIP